MLKKHGTNLMKFSLALFLASSFVLANPLPKETHNIITKRMEKAQQRHGIFGQSLAILQDGELVYLGSTGLANIEFNIPASPDTVYSIYSATKLFVSIRLLQLVEQEKLALTETLGNHFPELPVKWRSVTVLEALSHISGLPEYSLETMTHISGQDAIANAANKPMEFATGTKTGYNQTNFYYMQKLIEKFDSSTLEETITTNMIVPLGLDNTSFGGEFDVIEGRATRYEGSKNGNKRVMRNDPPSYYYGANGMNSSVKDIAKWFHALLNEEFISLALLRKAWQPISLSSGQNARHTHGWEYKEVNGFTAVGHYGANLVNVRHFFSEDIKHDSVTVIHLTNGRSEHFNPLDFSYSLASEIKQEMKTPIRTLKEVMLDMLEANTFKEAREHYLEFKVKNPELSTMTEEMLNSLGYLVLTSMNVESAIKIFELACEEYPDSANAFDSLAEAYLEYGDEIKAKLNYQKALSMDKDNARISTILERLN